MHIIEEALYNQLNGAENLLNNLHCGLVNQDMLIAI